MHMTMYGPLSTQNARPLSTRIYLTILCLSTVSFKQWCVLPSLPIRWLFKKNGRLMGQSRLHRRLSKSPKCRPSTCGNYMLLHLIGNAGFGVPNPLFQLTIIVIILNLTVPKVKWAFVFYVTVKELESKLYFIYLGFANMIIPNSTHQLAMRVRSSDNK